MNILKDVKKKNPLKSYDYKGFDVICIATCGERGIRTPGPVTVNSFQDCRIRPLCHFSLVSTNIVAFVNCGANIK